jgi:hypothetical protein
MRAHRLIPFFSLSAFMLLGANCPGGGGTDTEVDTGGLGGDDGDGGSDDGGSDDGGSDEGGDDTGVVTPGGFSAKIQGTVQVLLYTLDEDGEYTYISWADAYNDVFIFGDIFVAAFTANEETGEETYYDDYVIVAPSTSGDAYELEVSTAETFSVRVMAANDYWGDKIIGTSDPIGNYPDEITDPDPEDPNNVINGIDVSILIPYWDGTSGGGCGESNYTYLSGDIVITTSYAGGDAAAMVLNTANEGPYHSTWITPEPDGGGASGEYGMYSCTSYGEMNLVGAWDSNYNGLADPAGDQWGVYISDTDIDGNPVDLSAGDMSGLDIQIPFGFDGLDLTPFVRFYGEVSYDDTLPSGTQVYVAALKYRPNSDIYVSDLADGYDYEAFDASAVSAGSPWAYSLVVPANTITYLWAYADTDNDGVINEAAEPVRSGGDEENGRLPTGEESQEYNLELVVVDESD